MLRAYSTSLLLLTLAGLWACKKEEQNPTLRITQRVFTNGKEIKDKAVKSRFIQKSQTPFTELSTSSNANYTVRFIKSDTAIFGADNMRFSVTKNNAQYLFYSPLLVQVSDASSIFRLMLKYASPLVPYPISSGFGYLTKEVRVGYNDHGAIRLSVLHYYFKQTYGGIANINRSGYLFNEFNEAAIASISASDTLAIQESSVMLSVQ